MDSALEWWLSSRRNVNFWDWVRDSYTDEEMLALTKEATDCSLIGSYNPFGNQTMDQFLRADDLQRKRVKRLMKRYGNEIVSCCMGAGGYDAELGKTGIQCLAKLDLSYQVHNQTTLEEFLVRNALKRASEQLLKEGRKKRRR